MGSDQENATTEATLTEKAVVITGAGQGLGEAYARHASAAGAQVVVNDIDESLSHEVTQAIRRDGGEAAAFPADITHAEQASDLINFCVQRYGAIHGLVNNAGVESIGLPEETREAELRRLIDVNVLGTAFCGVAAIRQMLTQEGGTIINATSGAQAGLARQSIYAMTKGAIASLTYTWALDLADRGIRVNAISPMAATGIGAHFADYYAGRGEQPPTFAGSMPSAADNAPIVTYMLSEAAAELNGQVVRIDGSRLSLMTHPAVLHPVHTRAQWDLASLAHVFADDLLHRQQPLGVAAFEVTRRDYQVPYAV